MPAQETPDLDSIRQHFRRLRRRLSDAERHSATTRIHTHLDELLGALQPQHVGAYLAFDGEVDLLEWLHRQYIPIAVPVIDPQLPDMFFATLDGHTQRNRLGIEEPLQPEMIAPNDIDLLLMPLVCWDASGTRIGMGAGYFDRYLAHHSTAHMRLCGVAFECQRSAAVLPRREWDIPLEMLVCESGIQRF